MEAFIRELVLWLLFALAGLFVVMCLALATGVVFGAAKQLYLLGFSFWS
ncbi:hypothetical protein UFOVP56_61 [uncultured Caudovirales phage]|jgi:hypothetical protein|uniref:Uncharacterized protein n=1 Tax=uncultured Caudovirales phage TaxID=2100421 RepID=A0A6J5T8R4_9CAUD|nr:hypothetical protein UFOVP56_61 [uncultured Caudovirales phage]